MLSNAASKLQTEGNIFSKKEKLLDKPIYFNLQQKHIYFSVCYSVNVFQLLQAKQGLCPRQFFLRNTGTVGGAQPGHMTWGTGHWCVAVVYEALSPQINVRWRRGGEDGRQPSLPALSLPLQDKKRQSSLERNSAVRRMKSNRLTDRKI